MQPVLPLQSPEAANSFKVAIAREHRCIVFAEPRRLFIGRYEGSDYRRSTSIGGAQANIAIRECRKGVCIQDQRHSSLSMT